MSYFVEQGFPKESLIEYLLTLLNSNFEEWRKANKAEDISKFPFNLKKMSVSGALFDMVKFNDVSKNIISMMPAEEVYEGVCSWAKENDEAFAALLSASRTDRD